MRRIVRATLLISLGAAVLGAGCRPPPSPEPETQDLPVVLARIQPRPMERTILLPGVVEAWEDRVLSAAHAGRIEWIRAEEGAWVEAGHRIAAIDEAALESDVTLAEARLRLADREYERANALHEDGAVSPETLDRAEVDRDIARAQLDAARARLGHGHVTAPVAGAVDELPVEVGEYVNPGDPVAHLVDDRRLKVTIAMPEREVGGVVAGDRVEVAATQGGLARSGTVTHVAAAADPATRTFRVTVELDAAAGRPDEPGAEPPSAGEGTRPHRLRPGTIVRARLSVGRLEGALALPFSVLTERDDVPGVMVYDEGKVLWRAVRLGFSSGAWVVVESGINPGDALIVEGHREVAEGDPVRVVEERPWDRLEALEPTG